MLDQEIKLLKKIERTSHTPGLYHAAFGQFISREIASSVLDVGAGDSNFAQTARDATGQRVARVDSDYATDPPDGIDWHGVDVRDLSHFYGDPFDVTISSFLMQHLSPEDQAKAIQEMVKVTMPSDGKIGHIGIFPVYKPNSLRKLLSKNGFEDVALVFEANDTFDKGSILLRKLAYDTLWIQNNKHLTPERREALASLIGQSDTLSRKATLRDLARRAFMQRGVSRTDTKA